MQWEELQCDVNETINMGKPKFAQLIGKNMKYGLAITKWDYEQVEFCLLNKPEKLEIQNDIIIRSRMDYAQTLKSA